MFDERGYADKINDDTTGTPPEEKGDDELPRCFWCERSIVRRPGGFCVNWDQIFGSCPHEKEAEAVIMRDG